VYLAKGGLILLLEVEQGALAWLEHKPAMAPRLHFAEFKNLK
jgi:hypothetical protein